MTVVVLGATGRTGRAVVDAALGRGHLVVALVRRPGSFDRRSDVAEHVWDGPGDATALAAATRGADVVISALGGASEGPTTVCTQAMATLVPLLESGGPDRLVAVSAHGVLDSHDRSLFVRAAWSRVGERLRDKETMEQVVSASSLRWTIVRPVALRDGGPGGTYRTGVDLPVRLWSSVTTSQLADFLLREAESPRYVHAHPTVVR